MKQEDAICISDERIIIIQSFTERVNNNKIPFARDDAMKVIAGILILLNNLISITFLFLRPHWFKLQNLFINRAISIMRTG